MNFDQLEILLGKFTARVAEVGGGAGVEVEGDLYKRRTDVLVGYFEKNPKSCFVGVACILSQDALILKEHIIIFDSDKADCFEFLLVVKVIVKYLLSFLFLARFPKLYRESFR